MTSVRMRVFPCIRSIDNAPKLPHGKNFVDTSEKHRGNNRYKTLLVDEKAHVEYARSTFYRALRRRAPNAMDELDQTGPRLIACEQKPKYAISEPETWPDIAPLGPFVVAWAQRHHISEPWVVIDAIDYVLSLANGDFGRDEAPHIHATVNPVAGIRLPGSCVVWTVEFDLPAFVWHTGSEGRASFEARVRARFDADLKRQLDNGERFAAAFGFANLDRPELWRDMERVVHRVVLGRSPADILQYERHPDPHDLNAQRAVTHAIGNACDLLGLPRPHRGRPPGKKPFARCVRVQKKRN